MSIPIIHLVLMYWAQIMMDEVLCRACHSQPLTTASALYSPPLSVSTSTHPLRNNIPFSCFMLPNLALLGCCLGLRLAAL